MRCGCIFVSRSIRDVEELLAQRGVEDGREAIRCWVIKFGPLIAANLRRRRSPPTGRWRLDEMVVKIGGRRMYLWRAVDDEGEVLDMLVQRRRNKPAAAIGWWGGVEVELMQQHCGNPSHLRDVIPDAGYGFVSVSWFAPDFEAETQRLEALGFPMCWSAEFGDGMGVRWFDARHVLGAMIEVFVEHPTMRLSFSELERASATWDGERLIRPMNELITVEL